MILHYWSLSCHPNSKRRHDIREVIPFWWQSSLNWLLWVALLLFQFENISSATNCTSWNILLVECNNYSGQWIFWKWSQVHIPQFAFAPFCLFAKSASCVNWSSAPLHRRSEGGKLGPTRRFSTSTLAFSTSVPVREICCFWIWEMLPHTSLIREALPPLSPWASIDGEGSKFSG